MSHESSERREDGWQIEREAKYFIEEKDVALWKERLLKEGLVQFHDAKVVTSWFKVPDIDGKPVSARLRTIKEKKKPKRFLWAVKVRTSPHSEAKHIKQCWELEGETHGPKATKVKLAKELQWVLGKSMPKKLVESRVLVKQRISYETNDIHNPLVGVRFDLDELREINGKEISPPIYILELEGLSETLILSASKHLGIDPQALSSISGTALLKEEGYL